MQRYSLPDSGPARRLALIVGDGLRADLLFVRNGFSMVPDSPMVVAPYLRSIVEARGAWGISHTRVPTETRPGHVALIGGMYEDVSEVTKGWNSNAPPTIKVDFDNVFNQSSTTYAFGAPTVLPMFIPGAPPGKIHTWTFNVALEDYTMGMLKHASQYPLEYMKNIQIVDKIVNQTEDLFREFYQDDDTAFVFTSDHGMNTNGNHGDGHPDSTRTPLIVWGKGVRGPLPDSVPSSHEAYSERFGLSHLLRRDVEQADVAFLMSALIGTSWPVNAMGMLPDVDPTKPGYLLPQEGENTLAEAALVNAKVLLEHYRAQDAAKKMRSRFYRPYSYFEKAGTGTRGIGHAQLAMIEALVRDGEYYKARLQAMEVIRRVQDGMHYLQIYDAPVILAIVIFAYLGWIALCAVTVLPPNPDPSRFGYERRVVWSAWLVGIGAAWPLVSWPNELRSRHWCLLVGWAASCLALSVFPLLSVEQEEDLFKITCGALAMCIAGWVGMRNLRPSDARKSPWFKAMMVVLFMGLGVSTALVYFIVRSLRAKQGDGVIVLNASLPFLTRFEISDPGACLLSVFLGIGAWFIWVAVSVEGLFYVAYALVLYFWIEVESVWRAEAVPDTKSSPEGTKRVAYFGPGNFPSLASFYLDPIYRLVSKYNPYLVLVLLVNLLVDLPLFPEDSPLRQVFKMFAPYILLALAFSLLHTRLDIPPFRLFIIALALADVMNLTFFLKVTHTGSWYNISQSFYNFCTSSLLVLLATVACIIGELKLPRRSPPSRSDAGSNSDPEYDSLEG
ncbi:transporter [Ganoderma sinense ZZ0214-1]|uniref:GPI ethanolamine phosphate transferase 1 n=1 Tax=Ganoderma sinense ZZ0214-1 TaxID=1077348 RepID=A0A2G8S0C7_9APHY|nr:transporter [Ganoderma sinense ZZ0214-1]